MLIDDKYSVNYGVERYEQQWYDGYEATAYIDG